MFHLLSRDVYKRQAQVQNAAGACVRIQQHADKCSASANLTHEEKKKETYNGTEGNTNWADGWYDLKDKNDRCLLYTSRCV